MRKVTLQRNSEVVFEWGHLSEKHASKSAEEVIQKSYDGVQMNSA